MTLMLQLMSSIGFIRFMDVNTIKNENAILHVPPEVFSTGVYYIPYASVVVSSIVLLIISIYCLFYFIISSGISIWNVYKKNQKTRN